jgi:hypothetical protein
MEVLRTMLDDGLETGRIPQAVLNLGNALGLELDANSSRLAAFTAITQQGVLAAAGQLTGTLSDNDVGLLRSTLANAGQGREANGRVLDVAEAVLERQRAELQLEARLLGDGLSPAAIDAEIQAQFAGRPVFEGFGPLPAGGSQFGTITLGTGRLSPPRPVDQMTAPEADAFVGGLSDEQLRQLDPATLQALRGKL